MRDNFMFNMEGGLEWACPSCTLINTSVSYKCQCCGTSKGTSTRQTKLDSVALEQQYAAESLLTSQLQRQQSLSKVSLKGGMPLAATLPPGDPVPAATSSTAASSSSSSGVVYSTTSDTSTINSNTTPSISLRKKRRKSPLPTSSESQPKLTAGPKRSSRMYKKQLQWPKLKNIDRSNAKCCKITVDSVTVNITEYQTPP